MIFYTNPGSALLPLLLSAVAAALLFLLGEFTSTRMPSAFSRYALNIIATLNIAQLSQDVLAFQVVLPMTVIMATLFYIFGNIHVNVDQQPRSAAR
jgi:phosphotransferase system  glucose/maltose/N-acetylglucosamine-specific IIC component